MVRSVADSLRRAMLMGLTAWHLLVACVVVVAEPRVPVVVLVVVHGALAALAVAALRGRVPYEVCLVLAYGAWLVDYLAARSSDDVITLAACWLGDLLYVASALTLAGRARTWLPIGGAAVVVAVIVNAGPVWTVDIASTYVVTAVAIVVAARLAMPSLWDLAEGADESARQLEDERGAQEAIRRASAESAEDSRVVHDTVINTLGAVANGVSDPEGAAAVRDRCLRDLVVVEEMLQGRRDARRRDLADVGRDEGRLEVRRTGLADSDLDELQDLLAPDVVSALVGAAEEAVLNVVKHSGVDTVTIEVRRTDADVTVTVSDDGVGFSPASTAGHGLTDSIVGRVEAVGGSVSVRSAPGEGTQVRITCALQSGSRDATEPVALDPSVTAGQLLRRACWLFSVGIVGVGVVIEAANRPGRLTWTYAMLAIVAACIGLSMWSVRRWGRLTVPLTGLLVVALPVAFVADVAGMDFGRADVLYYQAIGIAPPLMILLALGSRRAAWAAGTLLVATASVIAVVMSTESAGYGAVIVVAVAPAVGLGVGWAAFERLVERIVAESEATRRLAFAAAVDGTAQREIAEARRRWGTAGLERSATLLRGIGHGELDLAAPAVRRTCAVEEEYLRQLLLLSPAAYRMSVWFAHALAAARARGVHLVIRSGDQDVPDAGAAAIVGSLLLHVVSETEPGADVTVGWFRTHEGVRLVVVGPATGAPRDPGSRTEVPESWSVVRTALAHQEVLEVVVP